jgi:splicing factor 3B subunit 3
MTEEFKEEVDWAKAGSYPKAVNDQFASCVRIVDPYTMETLQIVEFEENYTCFSIYVSSTISATSLNKEGTAYHETHGESFLFCGVGLEAKLCPRSCTLGFIKTYKFTNGGK